MVKKVITVSFAGTCSLIEPEEDGVLNGPVNGIAGVDAFNIPALIKALTDTGEDLTPESTQVSLGYHGPGAHTRKTDNWPAAQFELLRGAANGFVGPNNIEDTSNTALMQIVSLLESSQPGDEVEININGWSRGAIAAQMLLDKLYRLMQHMEEPGYEYLQRIKQVNLHCIDPVIGGPFDRYGHAKASEMLRKAKEKLDKVTKAREKAARAVEERSKRSASAGAVDAKLLRLQGVLEKKQSQEEIARQEYEEVRTLSQASDVFNDIEVMPNGAPVKPTFFHSKTGNLKLFDLLGGGRIFSGMPFFSGLWKKYGLHLLFSGNHQRMALDKDVAFDGVTPEALNHPDYPRPVLEQLLGGDFAGPEYSAGRLSGVVTLLRIIGDLYETGAIVDRKLPENLRSSEALQAKLQQAHEAYQEKYRHEPHRRRYLSSDAELSGWAAWDCEFVDAARHKGADGRACLPTVEQFQAEKNTHEQELGARAHGVFDRVARVLGMTTRSRL